MLVYVLCAVAYIFVGFMAGVVSIKIEVATNYGGSGMSVSDGDLIMLWMLVGWPLLFPMQLLLALSRLLR